MPDPGGRAPIDEKGRPAVAIDSIRPGRCVLIPKRGVARLVDLSGDTAEVELYTFGKKSTERTRIGKELLRQVHEIPEDGLGTALVNDLQR